MKKNILYLSIIIILINFSCDSKKEFTYSQLKDISSGFLIKDSLIVIEVEKLINDKKLKIKSEEFISINITEEVNFKNEYYLEISKKNYNIEKQKIWNRDLKENNYKGYISYNKYILLLYGDINDFFENKIDGTTKDIFFTKNKIENEKIGIVYDPPIFKYKILNGKLIFVSGF